MAEILKELDKARESAMARIGAQFKYIQKISNELQEIKDAKTPKEARKKIRGAESLWRWAGRGEFYSERDVKKVEDDMKKLEELVPPEFKDEAIKLSELMVIANRKLMKGGSRFTGDIKHLLNKLKDEEQEEALIEDAFRKGKANERQLKAKEDIVLGTIRELQNKINEMLEWMAGEEALLKNVGKFIEKLKRWIRKG